VHNIDGSSLNPQSLARIRAIDFGSLPIIPPGRLGPCVGKPGKFICIGLNYHDHVRETGAETPREPTVFMKATSALSGPNDPIIQPRGSVKLDWEVELAFVIGEECRYVDQATAAKAIAGYFICNDVSERSFQMERGGQWDKGKGCDSFGPIGPWLVTADEIPDPCDLAMRLSVNDKLYQNGSSREMVFRPAFLVSYLSQFMSLQAGDIVTSGTPAGVGLGQTPPTYLKPGDVVELSIDHLGTQRQTVVQYEDSGSQE
jgi:2,4-didehydro-3-deoxy-L-rhamnonate hydrolase